MALTNEQYDAIMRIYDERRFENHRILVERREEIYNKIPEYKKIDDEIADYAFQCGMKRLSGDKNALNDMKGEIEKLSKKKALLLKENGYSENYLNPVYTCSICQDSGFVGDEKCICFKQEIIKAKYEQSNIGEILKKENFDTLSYDFYYDNELEAAKKVIDGCKRFADEFDDNKDNLILFGPAGTGKTFLTNCIAKKLIDTEHSVLYFTSFQLFDTLAKYTFNNQKNDEEISEVHKDILSCDALIIDDLGTELESSFCASQLFLILNERKKAEKSTIISTNLLFSEIAQRYSERVSSRILGDYIKYKIDIADIRVKKAKMNIK